MIREVPGRRPRIDPDIDPQAAVIGDVTIGPGSSVWPFAVLRGDQDKYVTLGRNSNVQDNSVLHRALAPRLPEAGRRAQTARVRARLPYLPIAARAAAIFAFTASRLKLAPFCIGGYSMAVTMSFSTCSWTNTKRQNSYWNHWK